MKYIDRLNTFLFSLKVENGTGTEVTRRDYSSKLDFVKSVSFFLLLLLIDSLFPLLVIDWVFIVQLFDSSEPTDTIGKRTWLGQRRKIFLTGTMNERRGGNGWRSFVGRVWRLCCRLALDLCTSVVHMGVEPLIISSGRPTQQRRDGTCM